MRVRVADRRAGDGDVAGRRLDRRVRPHAAAFQRERGGEGLHRRAGLEDVGQRAVAQPRAGQALAQPRVEARVVGQRQHLAALHVEHDHAAGARLVLGDRVAHALVGEELHLRVDRQLDVLAVHRIDLRADGLDDAAEPVLDDQARAVAALQLVLEREFDAFLPPLFDVRETDHVRRGFAFRVLAAVLAFRMHALDAQRLDLQPQRFVDLPAQPGEVAARVEALLEFGRAHAEQRRELAPLLRVGLEVLRDRPDRRRGHARGQHQAVAVDDAPAAGRHLERVGVALLALHLIEVGADDLDVDGAADQHQETQAHQRDQQPRTPRRRLRREQRAGRVVQAHARRVFAAAHESPSSDACVGRSPEGMRAGLGAARRSARGKGIDTGCLMARPCSAPAPARRRDDVDVLRHRRRGVAHRSFSRATCSTRRCVPCALASASSRLKSVSSCSFSARARSSAVNRRRDS